MYNWTTIDKTFIFDGTIEGLFTIVYMCFDKKIIPRFVIDEQNYIPDLFNETMKVETNLDKSIRVFKGITNKISKQTLYNVYNSFLSNEYNKSNYILSYLMYGFKLGYKVNYMRNLDPVLNIERITKKVTHEGHKLKGFTRFRKTKDNILYAEISPDNNIIEILAKHFSERLKNEKWIIHDIKRNIAAFYDKDYVIVKTEKLDFNQIVNCEQEEKYQILWKNYFEKIAIKERTNLRCQMNFMPKKYWVNLTEFKSGERL